MKNLPVAVALAAVSDAIRRLASLSTIRVRIDAADLDQVIAAWREDLRS